MMLNNLTSVQRWSSKLDRFPEYRALPADARRLVLQQICNGELSQTDTAIRSAIESLDARKES
jgi:hypothetical protein